jgi:hypothetical protein
MNTDEIDVQDIINKWFAENLPGINPKNTAVLFYVSFKGCHDTNWTEYSGGRVCKLEDAERIVATDGRVFTLRKVHIGEQILSLWKMEESRDTISCIYRNDVVCNFYAGKDYSHLWR